MSKKGGLAPRNGFHFVHCTGENNDKSGRSFQARAHTARVNRRRQRKAIEDLETSQRRKPHRRKDIDGEEVELVPPDVRRLSPISRTLSPVFGGFTTDIFQPASMATSSQVLHYNLTVIYPSFIHRPEVLSPVVQNRFKFFCEHPTLFHSYHFTAAAHYDIMRKQLDWYDRPDMIWHKSESIRHLREMISNLNKSNIEVAIVAIMYLDYGEFTEAIFTVDEDYAFDPPTEHLMWMEDCWNRMVPSEAHAKAIYLLVDRAGGLESLKTAALSLNLGRWDLRRASIRLEKPRLACMWTVDEQMLDACHRLASKSINSPGNGFQKLRQYEIPYELLDTLLRLSELNEMIFDTASSPELGHHQLRDARSALHHRLLSVPTWHELHDKEKTESKFLMYECSRLTAILYSSAVLLGIPSQTKWLDRFVPQLRRTLETRDPTAMARNTSLVFLWILFLGTMASQGSEHQEFFEDMLRRVLRAHNLISWQAVENVLLSFVWSKSACGRGAALLWIKIEPTLETIRATPC